MKVIKSQGTKTRTSSEIDLFSDNPSISEDTKARVTDRVGMFLVEQILSSVATQQSPVEGEAWPTLSSEYRKYKKSQGATPVANMELTGDMLNSLTYRPTAKGVEVGVFGSEAPKADGHNKFSGLENNTPQRRFLPGEGQEFRGGIQSEVDAIIAEEVLKDLELTPFELKSIDSSAELYEVFSEKLPGYSSAEIKDAILANPDLLDQLNEFDLLEYL